MSDNKDALELVGCLVLLVAVAGVTLEVAALYLAGGWPCALLGLAAVVLMGIGIVVFQRAASAD